MNAHPRRDHSRSRGVYSATRATTARACGSSPLARGLRRPWEAQGRGVGIIPARAGFTRRVIRRRPPPADHPRSRGVYWLASSTTLDQDGSSPLARGLLDEHGRFLTPTGIIPARAGFTPSARG